MRRSRTQEKPRPSSGREPLAKGQKRSNRELKKPKADKKKSAKSASIFTPTAPNKKKPGSA
jgi:hypothetical protein